MSRVTKLPPDWCPSPPPTGLVAWSPQQGPLFGVWWLETWLRSKREAFFRADPFDGLKLGLVLSCLARDCMLFVLFFFFSWCLSGLAFCI